MKRKSTIIAAMILATSMIATPVYAADTAGLDLDSMSVEDLVGLRDTINAKIGEKGGDNIISQGVYEVGVDIKASNFKVINVKDDQFNIYIYASKEDYESYTTSEQILLYSDDTDGGIMNLKEGEIVSVTSGSAVIEEISNASWMPDKE